MLKVNFKYVFSGSVPQVKISFLHFFFGTVCVDLKYHIYRITIYGILKDIELCL